MRGLKPGAVASTVIAASVCLASLPALAEEFLVMPYACSMAGGQPLLTPAQEQSHRIIGQREQRPFTACSPANPDLCRDWSVYRFDIDCDGARVPWVAVVAAASDRANGRAWIEDGRLRLRMPRSWSLAPDDPCARQPGFDERFGFGRMRRYCDDRRAMAPPPVVEMPIGFAPMLGIDAIFVKSSGPTTSAAPPPPVAVAPSPPPPKIARAEPPVRPDLAQPSPADGGQEALAKDTPKKTLPPPQAAVPPPASAAPPPAVAPKAPPAAIAPPQPVSPTAPVIPKIINRPEAPPGEPSAPPATASASKPESGQAPQPSQSIAKKDAGQPDTILDRPVDKDRTATVSLLNVVRSPAIGALAALGGLAGLLLAVFAIARRRERTTAQVRPHDFASASIGGRRGDGAPIPPAGGRALQPRASAAAPRPASARPAAAVPASAWPAGLAPASDLVGRIPHTRAEALQILGMGVTPDANEMAMKKIVDGLRLSWHPDLANDETDRQLREFRLKQINAAWELIQGKRLERLDS